MKKVLFVMHTLGYGGAERSLVNLLHELPDDKYEIDLLLFQKKGDFLEQVPKWVRVLDTPEAIEGLYASVSEAGKYRVTKVVGTLCGKIVRKTKKAQSAYRWNHFYKRKIEKIPQSYDVAVAYVGAEIMYFIKEKVDAKRKLVWIHNDYRTAGYSKIDDYPYFVDMDAIVSVSNECVDVLKEEFPEFQNKMYYLENITSSAMVRKRAEAYIPIEYVKNGCNILSVGRLFPQKGFDMAVEAAAILRNQGLDFKWFVVGDGKLREHLQQQIKALAVDEHFILLGTRNNPYPYIKNCTFLVQPSRYEGKSVVLDETKILGIPIVATAYPTVKDQVVDGKEGIVTEMSPQGIAEGIAKFISNRNLRDEIHQYMIQKEYGNQEEVKKYMKLLDE